MEGFCAIADPRGYSRWQEHAPKKTCGAYETAPYKTAPFSDLFFWQSPNVVSFWLLKAKQKIKCSITYM